MTFPEHMLKDKKISFFVAETYPSYAGGGRNAYNFGNYLAHMKAQVQIVCLNYNNTLTKRETSKKVQIYRIPYYNKTYIHKLFSIPLLLIKYFRHVLNSDIILIYGKYMPGYLSVVALGKILKKCVIFRSTMLGEDDLKSLTSGFLGAWKKHLFKRINCYFAINKQFEQIASTIIGKELPVFTSYQGIDPTVFNTKEKTSRNTEKNSTIHLLCIGMLVERKGYQRLFETLSTFKTNFILTIIGQYIPEKHHRSTEKEKNEMQELFNLGSKLLGDKVIFLNTVSDVKPYLNSADIFIYCADQDGTPNVVLEAMAAGLPVLMYQNLPDTDLFIPEKTIEIFNDFKEIPEKIQLLHTDKSRTTKIANHAALIISKNYTFEKIATQLFKTANCKALKE